MLQLARVSVKATAAIVALMLAAAAMAIVAAPNLQTVSDAPLLDATVPQAFGDWKAVQDKFVQVGVSQGVETAFEQPYDQTLMRTYVNSKGEAVMLALAWGERQRQDIKIHRPEVCYPAQGYQVRELGPAAPIAVAGRTEPVPTISMVAGSGGKGGNLEAVRYWIRIGNNYTGDGLKARLYILQEGLNGRIVDGMLVRASQRLRSPDDIPASNAVMEQFLRDLTHALPPETLALLVR